MFLSVEIGPVRRVLVWLGSLLRVLIICYAQAKRLVSWTPNLERHADGSLGRASSKFSTECQRTIGLEQPTGFIGRL